MGWSHQEELLCVQEDGMVLIYDMFGNYQHTFSMGEVDMKFEYSKLDYRKEYFILRLV